MALDRSKVLETAQKHLAKGNYDKAIAEYQRLVKEDPKDVRTWLKIGDLFTRKGARTEACETYNRVAEHYAEQGFFLKAVAVYKQILKLDPGRLDVSLRLADMYEQLQLVSDALNTYEHVAAAYARSGDIDRALATLGRMCELDPDNIPNRIKYAEALSKAGRTDDAAREFEAGAGLLKEQGRIDDYVKVAERLLFHRPDDMRTARELSTIYLARNDAKRALSKLQLCFKADPKDIETLEMLARAFHILGQTPKTISVYREVARLHLEAKRPEERARVLKRILELDPNDAEARQALAGYAPRGAAPQPAAPPPSAVVGSHSNRRPASAPPSSEEAEIEMLEAEEDDVYLLDEAEVEEHVSEFPDAEEPVEEEPSMSEPDVDVGSMVNVHAVPAPAPGPSPSLSPVQTGSGSIPPDVAREAQIARLLTECDVFLRYGLKNKVLDQLQKVIAIDPTHVEARERLKDAFIDAGQPPKAIEQLYALSDLFQHEKPQLSQLYLRQVLEIDPDDERARTALSAMGPAGEDDILFVDEERPHEEEEEHYPAAAEDEPHTLTDASHPAVVMAEQPPEQPGESLHAIPPPGLGTVPGVELPVVAPGTSAPSPDSYVPISAHEFDSAHPPDAAERARAMADAEQRLSIPPGEVEEALDETDFFLAQGLFDEARATIEDALDAHPNHPVLLDKLAEIEEARTVSASMAPVPMPAPDQSFQLAEKLAEELGPGDEAAGSDVLDVEAVFAQFKKGVVEQIGLEDSDTHFDLGIAYKEMGLLDDAIHEFELAMSNSYKECIAHTMIGLCYIEKGQIADAISHFKKGLYAENKNEREELGLYFELGCAYELLHDPKEALYYFQKVAKRQPDFRGVIEKIKNLTQPQQPPPAQNGPAATAEDVDAAFDDLISEGD